MSSTSPASLLPADWPNMALVDVARLAPVQTIQWKLAATRGVEVAIKREDLLDVQLGGNKFYKLHGHLQNMVKQGQDQMMTFGGAYSNHLLAAAAAAHTMGFKLIAVVRGERPARLSATLTDIQNLGARLIFVNRSCYRLKAQADFLSDLRTELGDFYCVPEGGGDTVGAQGCEQWAQAAIQLSPWLPTRIGVAVGTGATAAGCVAAANGIPVFGVSSLKGRAQEYSAMSEAITALANAVQNSSKVGCDAKNGRSTENLPTFTLETDYSCGGYARFPTALQRFVTEFERESHLQLDPVYTAKLFYGLADKLSKGEVRPGEKILLLHTGGLQGRRGFPTLD